MSNLDYMTNATLSGVYTPAADRRGATAGGAAWRWRAAVRDGATTRDDVAAQERSAYRYQRSMVRLLAMLAAIWLLFTHVISLTPMASTDMAPAIQAGDMLLISRLDADVHASDVVAFHKDDVSDDALVGRVVAVAGDTVEVRGGHVIVNGNSLREQGISETTDVAASAVAYPLTLAEGQSFVLADDRAAGIDSRYFGPVEADELVGTVVTFLRRNDL